MIRKRLISAIRAFLRPVNSKSKTDKDLTPTELWLRAKKQEFKKNTVVNPESGMVDMRYNPLAMDDGPCCFPIREGTKVELLHDGPDQSEELAFLEWLEREGINLPKKDILRNDNQWRGLDVNYNPLANDEDFFIPVRAA